MITKDEYYLRIAQAAAARANCVGRAVGAVIVRGDRVISTGYNGTPGDVPNCLDGGCRRCANRSEFPSGRDYDLCICVHAEANALATAARFGLGVEGGVLYATHQPCFSCSKELVQAGITKVYYIHEWPPPEQVQRDYWLLQGRLRTERKTPGLEEPGDSFERAERPGIGDDIESAEFNGRDSSAPHP